MNSADRFLTVSVASEAGRGRAEDRYTVPGRCHGIPGVTVDTHVFEYQAAGLDEGVESCRSRTGAAEGVLPTDHWNEVNFQLLPAGDVERK